jgi:hypothetical protein
MSSDQQSFRELIVISLLLIGVGLALSIWTSMKANRYYYPEEIFGRKIQQSRTTLKIKRAGRHEIDYDDDLGDLTFTVTNSLSTADVPVSQFGLLTELFHTSGQTGAWFDVAAPGEYSLTVDPWPEGAELFVDYRNTRAIANWHLLGMVGGGLMIGFGGLLFFVASYRKAVAAKLQKADDMGEGE